MKKIVIDERTPQAMKTLPLVLVLNHTKSDLVYTQNLALSHPYCQLVESYK